VGRAQRGEEIDPESPYGILPEAVKMRIKVEDKKGKERGIRGSYSFKNRLTLHLSIAIV